jgi:Na+/H+ antiporter NhaD/arsenite permease-like protein
LARLAILLATYLLIAVRQVPFLRLNRPAAALLGAVAMVTIGGLPLHDAYAAIDLDVMVFLLGVLLLTGYLEAGGFFEWAARQIIVRAHSPRALLGVVVAMSGLLSAFFVNDTICLVFTPLMLAVLRPLGLRPLPFLLAIALGSNVGSAMTPTGNPQNMLIGVASGIHFARFIASLALPSLGGLVIVYGVLSVVHREDLTVSLPRDIEIPEMPFDRPLVVRSLIVFAGALVGWLAGASLPLVAITAAAILLAIAQRDPTEAFAKVEWSLLLFFGALFVVMRGARDLPLVASLTSAASAQLHGAPLHDDRHLGGNDRPVEPRIERARGHSVVTRRAASRRSNVHVARHGDELDIRRQSHVARLHGEPDRRRARRGARCADPLRGLFEGWCAGDGAHGVFGNRHATWCRALA